MTKIRHFQCINIHKVLGKSSVFYLNKNSLSDYGLKHGAFHLGCVPDKEQLWRLLRNEDFRSMQSQRSLEARHCLDAFRHGMALQILQQGGAPKDDGKLAWLCLRSGNFMKHTRQSVDVAFDWFQEDVENIDDVLLKLSVLDHKRYYKASLFLLWIETERQQTLPFQSRNTDVIEQIFEELKQKISGENQIHWGSFISVHFMYHVLEKLISVWSSVDRSLFYEGEHDFTLMQLCEKMMAMFKDNHQKHQVYSNEVLNILEYIKKDKPKFQTFLMVIQTHLQISEPQKALKIVDQLLEILQANPSIYFRKPHRLHCLIDIGRIFASHSLVNEFSKLIKQLLTLERSKRERIPEMRVRIDSTLALQKCIHLLDEQIYDEKDNTLWSHFFIDNLMVFQTYEKGMYTFPIITEMILIISKRGHKEHVVDFVQQLSDPYYKALSLLNCGDYEKALQVASNSPEQDTSKLRTRVIQLMIDTYPMLDNDIFIDFLDFNRNEYFHKLILSFTHQGKIEKALSILPKISNQNYHNRSIHNIAVSLGKQGDFDSAFKLISEIKDESSFNRSKYHLGLELLQKWRLDEAFQVYDELTDKDKKTSFISKACTIAAKRGHILSDYSEQMITDHGCSLSIALAEKGDFTEALDIVAQITDDDKKSLAMEEISAMLLQERDITDVISFAKKIPKKEHKSRTLSHMARTLFEQDEIDKLCSLIEDISMNRDSLMDIFFALEQANQPSHSSRFLDALTSSTTDHELSSILVHFIKKGRDKDAFRLFCSDISHIEEQNDGQKICTKVHLLTIFDNDEKAIEELQNADFYWKHQSWKRIILQKLHQGLWKESVELTSNIVHDSTRRSLIGHIIQHLLHNDQHSNAIAITKSLPHQNSQRDHFIQVLQFLLSKGKLTNIIEIMKKHDAFINSLDFHIEQGSPPNDLFANILRALVGQSKIEECYLCIQLSRLDSIEENLIEIVSIFLEKHHFDEALYFLSTLEDSFEKPKIPLVKYLMQQQRIEEAKEIMGKTSDPYSKIRMRMHMIENPMTPPKTSKSLYQEILQIIEMHDHIHDITFLLTELIYMNSRLGWLKEIESLIQKMFDSKDQNMVRARVSYLSGQQENSFSFLNIALTEFQNQRFDNGVKRFIDSLLAVIFDWENRNLYVVIEMCTNEKFKSLVLRRLIEERIFDKVSENIKLKDVIEKHPLQQRDIMGVITHCIKKGMISTALYFLPKLEAEHKRSEQLISIVQNQSTQQLQQTLPEILQCVFQLQNIHHRSNAFLAISATMNHLSLQEIIHQSLLKNKPSPIFLQNIVPEYQKDISSLQHLRYSLMYNLFDPNTSELSIWNLLAAHYKLGNREHVREILNLCPSLAENLSLNISIE
jgi:tetratricopeptide (TPR) repeat protein